MLPRRVVLSCGVLGLLLGAPVPPAVPADADDAPAPAGAAQDPAQPALTSAQEQAAGITVLHPLPARSAQPVAAYGEVLDVAALVSDEARVASTGALALAAAAEAQRLAELYRASADASLRALEAARAANTEAQAQARIASADFAAQWGPLAQLSDARRSALIAALLSGRSALVRADIPGRLRLGAMPQAASVDLDGVPVTARVLGTLPRSASDSQSVGLLLLIEHAPSGLGAGARARISLRSAVRSGVLVPDSALLYGEQGTYVYKRIDAHIDDHDPNGPHRYAPASVQLLQPSGTSWLVTGLDGDDTIVVTGAGVLWSLQGVGSFSADEEDHD